MIARRIHIKKYDWVVHVFYAVTCYWTDRIMDVLESIGCPERILRSSYKNLMSCKLDTGLTYSNYNIRETVMVVGLTSSPAEFLNSFDHERKHLEAHIAQAYDIYPYGEEIAYLSGDIAQMLVEDVQLFICDCDKHKQIIHRKCNCHA